MVIPLNRVVAFVLPPIQAFAALAAAYIVAKLNVLGFTELDTNAVAQVIAGGLIAALIAGLSALGNWQWLKGHHIEIAQGSWSGDPTDLRGDHIVAEPVDDVKPTP